MFPTSRSPASRQLVCNIGHARARTIASSLGPAVASISYQHVSHSTSPVGRVNSVGRTYSTRLIHSSTNRPKSTDHLTIDNASSLSATDEPQPSEMPKTSSPLAVLPLTNVLRSWMTTTVSSSPFLLPPSLSIMSVLAHTTNPALNPDRNPLLRAFLKKTFYAQFCAGENPAEVRQTIDSLKQIGFSGVILGYAREVVLTDSETKDLASCAADGAAAEECIRTEVNPWAEGTMETVRLASPGDFVALKFTGAGRQALYSLSKRLPPSEALGSAINGICKLAAERGVRLLFDAEQTALQPGIDDWTLDYMRLYNKSGTGGNAVVYGTYQAYLKSTPSLLSKHLAIAATEGFTLGVKLVRGAYLGADPRHLICDTKADTDSQYDGIAESLLRKSWSGGPLQPPAPAAPGSAAEKDTTNFPDVNVVLATHNRESVLKGKALLDSGVAKLGYEEVAFAQLQGMADEVSCELVAGPHESPKEMEMVENGKEKVKVNKPQVYKYLVWGSTGECMKYLLRRAYENRDAVQRTRSGREAMGREVGRRVKGLFGVSSS